MGKGWGREGMGKGWGRDGEGEGEGKGEGGWGSIPFTMGRYQLKLWRSRITIPFTMGRKDWQDSLGRGKPWCGYSATV